MERQGGKQVSKKKTAPRNLTAEQARNVLKLFQDYVNAEEEDEKKRADLWMRVQMKLIHDHHPDPEQDAYRTARTARMAELHPGQPRSPEQIDEYDRLLAEIFREALADQEQEGAFPTDAQQPAAIDPEDRQPVEEDDESKNL
jgi:hypothetical protein